MRYKRKWLIPALVLLLLCSGTIYAQPADIIFEQKTTKPVAPGVVYETNWQFTPSGWLRLHVIRADISQPEIKSDLLLSGLGLVATERLSSMAAKAKAVAAINGDFFFGAGIGAPLGPVIKEGRLLSSPSLRRDLNVFALRSDTSAMVGSLVFKGRVYTPEGDCFPLAGWNKQGDSYNQLYGFDGYWGAKTPANVPQDSVAAMFKNGRLLELRPAFGGVEILPETQILIGAKEAAQFLTAHFTPGSQVKISLDTEPDWHDLEWAIGGGSVLIKDGHIVPFTHEVKGDNPRSAVGISADAGS